mmetsp:Transcript_55100/g.133877  ORF Transcript_55100/g.133877 Transcript_55100/m.133877 type:complete len:154 (-) Transcript_55100:1224-1685(-)
MASTMTNKSQQQPYEYVSYASPATVVADALYHFIRGSLYGAAYGAVTPFFAHGTAGAIAESKTGVFKPAPVLSQWRTIPSHSLLFGTLLGVQRLTCKTVELLRAKQDPWNDVVGIGVAYPYYQSFLATNEKLVVHNRVVGGAIAVAIVLQQLT